MGKDQPSLNYCSLADLLAGTEINLQTSKLETYAKCDSARCYYIAGGIKKVSRGTIDCPDCGHALIWVSKRINLEEEGEINLNQF